MKKGYTLLELVATIIILGIVGLIAYPTINKTINKNRERLYENQLKQIEESASKWAYQNLDSLPTIEGEVVTISLLELKRNGYIDLNIKNPINKNPISNDSTITITLKDNNYVYDINLKEGNVLDYEINKNSPIIILNGSNIEYVEINSTFTEIGASAYTSGGAEVNDINIIYYYLENEISTIPTNELKTYTAVYEVTDNSNTSRLVRTYIVRDSIAPELTVPSKLTISLSELDSYNLLDGVEVTDNSNEDISVTVLDFDKTQGEKVISYKACDSSNNCTTKNRILQIN